MIDWLESPQWESFTLHGYKSTQFGLKFGIVSDPSKMTDSILTRSLTEELVQLYCKFHFAHLIKNPIIIFPLQFTTCAASPLFNLAPNTPALYHIPAKNYVRLEEDVADTPFLLSHTAIELLEGIQGIFTSIYQNLEALHDEYGLIVLGKEVHYV